MDFVKLRIIFFVSEILHKLSTAMGLLRLMFFMNMVHGGAGALASRTQASRYRPENGIRKTGYNVEYSF